MSGEHLRRARTVADQIAGSPMKLQPGQTPLVLAGILDALVAIAEQAQPLTHEQQHRLSERLRSLRPDDAVEESLTWLAQHDVAVGQRLRHHLTRQVRDLPSYGGLDPEREAIPGGRAYVRLTDVLRVLAGQGLDG